MKSCKIVSCLLDYPSEQLWQAKDEFIAEIKQLTELTQLQQTQLVNFVESYLSMPLLDAQAQYYQTFEMGNMTSLLLFEHVHGDSRDRGQAMADLIDQYALQGIELAVNQLPDYLPLFLEYVSLLPQAECQKWLTNIAPVIRLIAMRLEKKQSHYHTVFELLYQISEYQMDDKALREKVAQEAPDDTNEALDKAWQETQVLFQGIIQADSNKSINNSTYYITVGDDPRSC